MAETVGRSVDKRLVYLVLMLLTLAYPLVALTLIVKTQNDYDDEGRRITPPLPQVTCPIEGAEGDIDCVASPLAYAHIDTIIWVFMFNEVVMHFTYVLYTKLWATAGIVFGFWREIMSIVAFLGPELFLNSFVYFLQTMPFARRLIPSLKTHHMPLMLGFLIGAMLSTCYGLGTAQTTDQFRRAVTLAGPGTMFLFVDWFSRSVFLPFFELMQNTFTQLKVNTFVLALFELVLTNLYGSLFLPATQKFCVVLAKFFYNVSYGVDSKVSLYDYVNLKPPQPGLDPSDPLSKRTTLVSPKDIGTYEPDACRSSISSLAKRKRFTGKSTGGTHSFVHSNAHQPIDASAPHEERPQPKAAARNLPGEVVVAGSHQSNASGAKQVSQLPATHTRTDRSDERHWEPATELKQGGFTVDKVGRAGGQPSGTRGKDNINGLLKRHKQETCGTRSDEATRRERRHQGEMNAVVDGSFALLQQPSSTAENKATGGEKKRSTGSPDAQRLLSLPERNGFMYAVDVEVSPEYGRILRPSVQHFSSAPSRLDIETDNHESENAHADDGAERRERHDSLIDNQPGQIDERSVTPAACAGFEALGDVYSSNLPSAMTDASGVPPPREFLCQGMVEANQSECTGVNEGRLDGDKQSDCLAELPIAVRHCEVDLTDDTTAAKERDPEQNMRSSRGLRAPSLKNNSLKEPGGTSGIVGSAETLSCRSSQCPDPVVGGQPLAVRIADVMGGVARQSESCQPRISSTARLVATERAHETPGATTGSNYEHAKEERAKVSHERRASKVNSGARGGRGRDSVRERPRRAHGKRHSQMETDHGGGEECTYAGEQSVKTQGEKRFQESADDGGMPEDDHGGEHARRAHRKRRSQMEANEGGAPESDHPGGHARGAHNKRQSQVDTADAEGHERENFGGEPVRRGRGKKQSLVEADDSERPEQDHHGEEPTRRNRGKRQSQVELGYGETREHGHAGEQTKNIHGKKHSQLQADDLAGLNRAYLKEQGQGRKRAEKRRSEAAAEHGERPEGQGDRDDQSRFILETATNAPLEENGTKKAKASRKHKKEGDEKPNDAVIEAAKPAGLMATTPESDRLRKAEREQLSQADSSSPYLFGPKGQKADEFGTHVRTLSLGSEVGSNEHLPSKATEDRPQPFRNNIYIPYRKGFGSDAVEFEKIITWFNMIWDSWRFLLLRTVMVKTSNVFIFFLMISKDYIFSMWHFCVRYDERCILTSLELRSVSTPKNRRLVRLLDWFQALVVRPFLMPKCLATTTWRSQLLFGLNAQKAQSRMRGVAVIRHSKRKDFGLRTLSNISDNAPLDAPTEPTPQKAVRGCGVLLKRFFKELGHDIAAHFRVELKLATDNFWGWKQNKSRTHLFQRLSSSFHDQPKVECEVYYNYASELVVLRNVPVTVYSRHSRSLATISSRSGSTSGSDRQDSRTHAGIKKDTSKIVFRDIFRPKEDSAFRKNHSIWISQVVEEVQSLVFNRTWPRLLQKLMSSLSLVASDIFAEHTKVGLLPAYKSFGLFRTFDGRLRLFLLFSLDILEVLIVWKVQRISRFYKSIKEGFNKFHDGPLLLLCTINCAGTLMYFGLLRYIRFASINGDKRILPDVNRVEVLTQLNLTK